jgi:hypothetical protein
MSGFSLKFATLLLTTSLSVAGLASTAAAQKGGVRKLPKKQQKQEPAPPPLPAYTPAPLQPLPLDQVPAVAPRVQYEAGELTIVAHNSTLADVLKAVRQQTGAEFDIPPNASERVVADIGPGPARDVLAQLLNGTHFNYVMVGSAADPTAVHSLLLTPKSGTPDTTTAANRPGGPQRGVAQAAVLPNPSADATPAMENDGGDDADTADEPPEQADQQNQQNPTQQTPKTPEQLLQELQRQQQQLQQQQNSQSGQPPQGILPNQPPTAAPPPNPNKPE